MLVSPTAQFWSLALPDALERCSRFSDPALTSHPNNFIRPQHPYLDHSLTMLTATSQEWAAAVCHPPPVVLWLHRRRHHQFHQLKQSARLPELTLNENHQNQSHSAMNTWRPWLGLILHFPTATTSSDCRSDPTLMEGHIKDG